MDRRQTVRAINIRITMRMHADAIGATSEFLQAFSTRNGSWAYPELHDSYVARHELEATEVSGEWWGLNPNDPSHPMNAFFRANYWRHAAR